MLTMRGRSSVDRIATAMSGPLVAGTRRAATLVVPLALVCIAASSVPPAWAADSSAPRDRASDEPSQAPGASVEVAVELPPYDIVEDGAGYHRVRLEGWTQGGEPGTPLLPMKVANIALPPDTVLESVRVEVLDAELIPIGGPYRIPPAPAPATWHEGEETIDWGENADEIVGDLNVAVYENDAPYPEERATLAGISRRGEWLTARVFLHPFSYNPVQRELIVAQRFSLRVVYDVAPQASTTQSGVPSQVVRPIPGSISEFSSASEAALGDYQPENGSQFDYVIITTNNIVAHSTTLAAFVTHRQSKGRSVLTITEGAYDILVGQAPNGREERIRQWLIDNYLALGVEAVLLIGDPTPYGQGPDAVPMKMCWPRYDSSTYRESPTDHFYADLTGNWDLDGDGVFGEYNGDRGPGGVDFVSEVDVGRIPVYDGDYASLDSILQKTIDYENETATGWRKSALLPMSFSDAGTDGAYLAEAMINDYLSPNGYSSYTMYQHKTTGCYSSFTSDEDLVAGAIKNHWQANDYGIMTWWAHGWSGGAAIGYGSQCSDGYMMTNADTAVLDDDHPAFTYLCSCECGRPEVLNLGYAMLRQGAIATVSASRVSWYASHTSWGTWLKYYADNASIGYYYDEGLVARQRAATALYGVKSDLGANLYSYWGGASWMNLMDFNLYGDPDVVLEEEIVRADMSVTKTDSPDPVIAGENLAYVVTATNNGPGEAVDVQVSDQWPSSLRLVSYSAPGASCTVASSSIDCTWFGATPAGSSRQLSLTMRVCPEVECETVLTNTVAVTSQTEDPDELNNSTAASTVVQTQSELVIAKSDQPDPVVAGGQVTYELTVSNFGPSNAADTVVIDTLPEHTSFVGASSSIGSCSGTGRSVVCSLGALGAPNQCSTSYPTSATVTVVADVSNEAPSSVPPCDGSPLENVAEVSTGNCLPDQGTLSATAVTDVLAGSDLEIGAPVLEDETPSGVTPDCLAPGDVVRVTQSFSNTGPNAYTAQDDNPGPEFSATLPTHVVGQPGTCVVLSGPGRCNLAAEYFGGRVEWNGPLAVGEAVTLQYEVRVRGGLPFGTAICVTGEVHYDQCNTGANTARRESPETCIALDCEPTVDPNSQLGKEVHLPILNFQGMDDVCRTWIEVQSIGSEYKKAVLVTWGEPGFCPPQCAGPLKVECSGLLKPGATWNFMGAQVPTGAKSGMLFQFTAKQLIEVGIDLGFDDVVADLMCETLFFGVVGDCDDYRRFKKAYEEEGAFAGVPLNDDTKGDGILAVDVLRHCPGDVTPGIEVSSKYNGVSAGHLGTWDSKFGGYAYYAPLVYADKAEFNSVLYIQNGGLECSSVEIWFRAQDDCLRARICEVFTLSPGETYQYDATDCVGPDWQGSAWLRSSQPLAIAVDLIGQDVLMTYVAEPAQLNYTRDPDEADFAPGSQVAFGPLVYSEYQGWDSGIQVQNLSSTTAAKVKAYFLDRSGDVVTTLVDWICPRGSQTFFLPAMDSLPGSWVGSVRVESQEWWSPGDPLVQPPNVVGVVTLIDYNDPARSDAEQAIAYSLLPEHKVFDWQLGFAGGGLESGVALLAIPSLLKDLDATGVTSELAIANVVPKPGFTDFAIFIYDQNGLLDFVCEKLNEKQVEYIDLQTWGYVNPGFKGGAIVSAVFWEHEVFDGTGFFLRNLVGLAAVAVERTGTRLGEDVPGDESAGARGIPFRQQDIEDEEMAFGFQGHAAPVCPGLPSVVPQPPEEP